MINKLNKLKSGCCYKALIASLCFVTASPNAAFSIENIAPGAIAAADNGGLAVKGTSLLMEASKNGYINTAKALITRGADINAKDGNGESAIQYAIRSKNYEIAKFLVDNGADTKVLGLQEAAYRDFLSHLASESSFQSPIAFSEAVPAAPAASATPVEYKELSNKELSPDFGDPVVNAADKGDLAKVKQLLSEGYSVNSTGVHSTTPLMRASFRGNEEMVAYLIKNGAYVNMADDAGSTALSLAKLGEKTSTEQLLIANGAEAGMYSDVQPSAGPLLVAAPFLGMSGGTAAVAAATVAGGAVAVAASNSGGGASDSSSGSGSGGSTPPGINGALTAAEKNSTGAGVKIAVVGNGVYNSGTYTDGSHAGSATPVGAGTNSSSAYNFTAANSNGVTVWDANSKDFVNSGFGATDGTPVGSGVMNGHDTETALIINQIASDSNILSVRAFDALGSLDPLVVYNAINYASSNGAKIINNSWGLVGNSGGDMNDVSAAFLARSNLTASLDINGDPYLDSNGNATSYKISNSIKTALTAGNVMVWAAGNEGRANPNVTAGLYLIDPNFDHNATGTSYTENSTYSKYWLVAAAVKDNHNGTYTTNNIDGNGVNSNQCGLTQARCLVAVANSTSHASAEVSAAVAKLIASGLSPDQAASRVLQTAFYLDKTTGATSADVNGAPVLSLNANGAANSSTDTITNSASNSSYGHGLLNTDLATSAYGALFVNTGNGTSSLLSGSSINLGKAFGDALANSGVTFIASDNGGNANSEMGSAKFTVNLDSLISRDKSSLDLDEAMSRLGNSQFANTTEYENGKLEFTPYSADVTKDQIISPENQSNAMTGNFAYTTSLAGSTYTLSNNVKMKDVFGFGAITASEDSTSITDNVQKNPYLGFAEQGFSTVMKNNITDNLAVKFGAFNGKEKNMYQDVMSEGKDVSGTVGEATLSFGDTSIGVQAGSITEKGAFLGSETSGIFATDGSTPTNFVGISAQEKLTDHLNIFGYYVQGTSTPTAAANTLFSGGISEIRSSAFSVGITYDGFEREGTITGFSMSQPLHVDSGSASFAYDGGSANLNLAPTGRETDFESYYHIKLNNNSSATVSTIYRMSPDNITTNKDEAIGLVQYKSKF